MKKFRIEIKETLSKVIEVKAECLDSAMGMVKTDYNNEVYILTADDYVQTDFYEERILKNAEK